MRQVVFLFVKRFKLHRSFYFNHILFIGFLSCCWWCCRYWYTKHCKCKKSFVRLIAIHLNCSCEGLKNELIVSYINPEWGPEVCPHAAYRMFPSSRLFTSFVLNLCFTLCGSDDLFPSVDKHPLLNMTGVIQKKCTVKKMNGSNVHLKTLLGFRCHFVLLSWLALFPLPAWTVTISKALFLHTRL